MKKGLCCSWIIIFILCNFMGNINVFSYQFINEDNKWDITQLKEDIYQITKEYYELYGEKKSNSYFGSYTGSLCPNGIMVEGYGTINFEEYVAGVVSAENGWYENGNIENLKAQAIASRTYALKRTNYCQSSIKSSQGAQVYKPTNNAAILRAVEETKGMILTYNGEIFSTEYDAFCVKSRSADSYTLRQPSQNYPGKYQVIPKSFVAEMGSAYVKMDYCYGHGRGMSQIGARYLQRQGYTYDQILSYYYPAGVEIVRPSAANNWKQYDSAWKNIKLGSSTLGDVGCYVTSIAILIAQSGVKTTLGDDFNPGTFAEYLSSHGAFSSGGALQSFASMSGLLNSFASAIDYNVSAENISRYIQQGKYVQVYITKSNGNSHFMAVTGVEGDNVYISDPGSSTCTVLSECYPGKKINNIRVYTIG